MNASLPGQSCNIFVTELHQSQSDTVRRISCNNVTDLVWQYLVQSVAVAAQRNSAVGSHVIYVYVLVYVDDKLSLGMNLVHNASNKHLDVVVWKYVVLRKSTYY